MKDSNSVALTGMRIGRLVVLLSILASGCEQKPAISWSALGLNGASVFSVTLDCEVYPLVVEDPNVIARCIEELGALVYTPCRPGLLACPFSTSLTLRGKRGEPLITFCPKDHIRVRTPGSAISCIPYKPVRTISKLYTFQDFNASRIIVRRAKCESISVEDPRDARVKDAFARDLWEDYNRRQRIMVPFPRTDEEWVGFLGMVDAVIASDIDKFESYFGVD